METKTEVTTAINEEKERKKKALDKIERRNEILGNIRTALVQIDNVCKVITERVKKPLPMPASPIYIAKMPEQPEHDCNNNNNTECSRRVFLFFKFNKKRSIKLQTNLFCGAKLKVLEWF